LVEQRNAGIVCEEIIENKGDNLMIAIIDYGLGNVRAFANVYHKLNIPAKVAKKAEDLKDADKIILPGVGAFDHAIELLARSGMRQILDELVLHLHIPVLGICVGMQMLAFSSEEGSRPGLGWIDGEVKKFKASSELTLYFPHMGWNNVKPKENNGLFHTLDIDGRFYFLHSYYFQCHRNEDIIAVTDYGGEFACAVNSGNVFGVQFHPEKSHQWGVQLLNNFAEL
jgi:imidazole glycerol-phosphate synthase subunit HisH